MGAFASRDPFVGFDTQPYSLHPYQYGYSNPVLFTDPTGECIGWVWGSPTCNFRGFNPFNWNYQDGATYAKSVINTAVVEPAQGIYTLLTDADARATTVQQLHHLATHPWEIPGRVWAGALETYHNLYAGLVCDDMERLGRGVVSAGGYVTGAAALPSAWRSLAALPSSLRGAGRGAADWWHAYNLEAQKLGLVSVHDAPQARRLFYSTTIGERFDPEKLARIQRALEKEGVSFLTGEEGDRFLKQIGAEAAYMPTPGEPGYLAFPRFPSRTQVVEELLHLGQNRRLGWPDLTRAQIIKLEIEAQEKLLRIGPRLGWSEGELAQIKRALDWWRSQQ